MGDISDNTEEVDVFEGEFTEKKSILVTPGFKKMSSKATIQWKDELKDKFRNVESEEGDRSSLSHLESRGTRWGLLRGHLQRLQRSAHVADEGKPNYQRVLGLDRIQHVRHDGLSPSQQRRLALLQLRVKLDNDDYIGRHPELATLLEMIFRHLVKERPDHPTLFVADYVHHLHLHREELRLDTMDVPFERPIPDTPEVLEDNRSVVEFAKDLVERCATIASRGAASMNVAGILESILHNAMGEPKRSAVMAVSEVLTSLMTRATEAKTTAAEAVADEILDSILENLRPSVRSAGEIRLEVRGSVEQFVKHLVDKVMDRATSRIVTGERSSTLVERKDTVEEEGENEKDSL